MPIKNRIASFENEMISWRHHFHENPELAYKEFNTSKKEIMEITSGEMHVCLPSSSDWKVFMENSSFEVPANSSFKVKVKKITNYCCSYID